MDNGFRDLFFLDGDNVLGEIIHTFLNRDGDNGGVVSEETPGLEGVGGVLGDGGRFGEDLVGVLDIALLDECFDQVHPEIPVFGFGLQAVVE